MNRAVQSIPDGTLLDNYIIDRTLSRGGFSIVYLARTADSGDRVVIKEYIPSKLARREANLKVVPESDAMTDRYLRGRRLFFQEASALAKLHHCNIVRVTGFFRANDTVYMVMVYEEGKNLQAYIEGRKGGLSEKFIRTVFPPLLEGLKCLHQHHLLHLDIKPSNIHLRPGGSPLLLDFGAVHFYQQSRQHQLGRIISHGYSPIEQYQSAGYVGPWTDIYAIGATMRSCIEGRPPLDAKERHEKETMRPAAELFRRGYSQELLQAIDWALEIDPTLRPQTVDAFVEALQADYSVPQSEGNTVSEVLNKPVGEVLGKITSRLPWSKS